MKDHYYNDISLEKKGMLSFLTEMDSYHRNRIKDEPVFEIISEGLKLFFQSGIVELAAFLSVETKTFTFKLSAAEPADKFSEAESLYNELLNEGLISAALQEGNSACCGKENTNSGSMVIPLSDPNGIQGLIILKIKKMGAEFEVLKKIFDHQGNYLALLLSNNRLNKKIKNVNNLLEQKLAYRTESIKQKKRELQTILDSINTGVFIIDKNTFEIVDVNFFALKMLGFEKSFIIGKNRKQFSHHWIYPLENESESVNGSEIELFNNKNALVPALNSIKTINLNGQEYLLESFIDISRIKKVERELRNSEYRLRIIFENTSFGMVLTDNDLRIVECNEAFRKMLGYASDELIFRKLSDYVFQPDLIPFNKYYSSSVIINKNNEIRFIDSNRETYWCRITATILGYSTPSVIYKLFIIEDISTIIASKDALYRQTNLLMGVADATNALLTLNDYETAIKQAIESLGKASEVDRVYIAKNIYDGNEKNIHIKFMYEWHSENSENVKESEMPTDFTYKGYFPGWYEELAEGRTIHGYVKNNRIPGIRFIESSDVQSIMIVPIFVNSLFWGFIGFDDSKEEKVWSEVEESILKATATGIGGAIKIKESQEAMLRAKDKAEKSDLLKSEFLAQMSHEIRTPINSILSFSGLIKDEFEPRLSSEYRSCFNAINRAGDRIIRTVDMILNMSDLQSGAYEITPSEYDLYDSVRTNLLEEFEQKAKDKGLNFVIHQPDFSTAIKGDEYTINQIFANLVDNALKYTTEGTVEITFENKGKTGFITKVKDTGIGISEEFLPKMFEPFTQEEQGYTRRYEGNGLGLALVKKYCDLSNITIDVKSKKGKGTIFDLHFPRR
jgi:PAS domain S-box-containing protein